MEISVLVFGQLTDITKEGNLKISGVKDISELNYQLLKKYPQLEFVDYSIAVNKKITRDNCILENNDVVALLPPFSGG